MSTTALLSDLRETLLPGRDSRHGPLPPLLLSMTLVTGLVDAFSYLLLGHVFVANMTGNVVFLGFALAGGTGSHAVRRLLAVATMLAGALLGAALVLHTHAYDPLAIALTVIILGATVTRVMGKRDPNWVRGGAV